MDLLFFSLWSKTPLTDVLLKNKKASELGKVDYLHSTSHKYDKDEYKTNDILTNISIKLVASKSQNKVCYAQANEDFVNLIFSFLTIPLGHVLKHVKSCYMFGCINELYQIIQHLDDQYFKSKNLKEMLINPKVLPCFSYHNDLFEMEEVPHPSFYYASSSFSGLVSDYR